MNLFAAEAVADPRATYERLRAEHGPVAPVLLADDLPAWLVLGYRENLEVARTPSRFTRDSRVWRLFQEGRVPATSPLLPMTDWKPLCRFVDGEDHRRLRSAINDSIGRFNRRGIRRHVTRFADQLIDGLSGNGEADLVAEFIEHLPMLVMTQLLGIPEEDGPRLVDASRDLMNGASTAVESNEYLVETLRSLVARKRISPGNDLASWLIGHPEELSDTEVMQHLRVILVITNETTISLIASTLRMVFTDLRFRASLTGGHMTLPDAVEQVLWEEPPFLTLPGRWATGDTEVGGQRIKAGDLLLLGIAAGNVDPAIRPDRNTPMHGNRSHLTFGGGAHECPGQDISRAIADTGIDTLLMRLPDLRMTVEEEELRWNQAWVTRHLAALPVEFTPVPPKDRSRPGARKDASATQAPLPSATPPSAIPPSAIPPSAALPPAVRAPEGAAPAGAATPASPPGAPRGWASVRRRLLRR
ncbi:cytochrome P450 [Streptomyces sp. N2-109]|uniref:Cytochrome P450 n=1 Tax=Streptomyces gossypii TaxID=2883101 RepID=A0ABT2JSS1_9ACTN|nr:cytochrome P450 [Streptomyces gossypii]MCT2590763.1 cytochrome P450 [Streptomyces gossypii]